MSRKTFVIMDTDGRYYRNFCDNFFTTAPSDILVTHTEDLLKARKFHSLMWATHRARFLSIKASRYYYVYEVTGEKAEQRLNIRNEQVIDIIRKNDFETMEEVERIIAEWKVRRGLD